MSNRSHDGRLARGLAAALALTVAMALAGCAVPPPSASSNAIPIASVPPPLGAEGTGAQDARILGTALQFFLLDPPTFSAEPTGDVKPGSFTRIYAHISAVSTSPASVTLDAVQFYPPGAVAAREAAKDHQPAPEQGGYERNAYRHAQTVSVAASAGVVGQFGGENDVTYGIDGAAQFGALPFADFARRFSAGGTALSQAGYWIVIDQDGVQSIAMQYAP